MISVLANLDASQVVHEPFPHIVAHDVLPPELYAALCETYPDVQMFPGFTDVQNCRIDMFIKEACESPEIAQIWKQFLIKNADREHLHHFQRLFKDAFDSLYPEQWSRFCALETGPLGIRGAHEFPGPEAILSSAISANTAFSASGAVHSVRGPHIDKPDKLWVGLYYMRPPEDTSEGGDLELHQFRNNPVMDGVEPKPGSTEVFQVVPYAANTLVIALNSVLAVHAVTPRVAPAPVRKFMSFYCVLPNWLYDLHSYQA